MTWSISEAKLARILSRIRGPLLGHPVTLLELQKLVGSLNDVGQMCPFLCGFRHPLHLFLSQFRGDEDISLIPPSGVRLDLQVWSYDTCPTCPPRPQY